MARRLSPLARLALEQAVAALELLDASPRSTERRAGLAVDARVDRAVRLARPARHGGDERAALLAQPLAALVALARPRRDAAARPWSVKAASAAAAARARRRRTAAARRRAAVVRRTSSSRRALDHSARNASAASARSPLLGDRLALRPAARARGCAPPRSAPASRLSRGSRGEEEVASSGRRGVGVRRMKRPTTWRKNSSVRARRRVDADAQPRDVDALGDHQHRHEPAPRAGGEARDPRRGVGRVGGHDLRRARRRSAPAARRAARRAPCRSPTTSPPASGARRRAGRSARASASRSTWAIQSPSGSSAVRSRRAASAAGSADREVRAPAAAVATSTPCRRRRCGT